MYYLSIIIPVYNVENYLRRCVDSLISQDLFYNAEILLIDDGSSDNSGKICDEYSAQYENIQTFHKKNGGLSDARNYGLNIAKGEYVSFIDSDDFVIGRFIKDMCDYIKIYNPDIIHFNSAFEKIEGKYSIIGDRAISNVSSYEMLYRLMNCDFGNQVTFNIFKKILFNNVRFPVGKVYEDIYTFYKLILNSTNCISVNYSYYIYNIINNGSITKTTNLKNMTDMFEAVNEQCEILIKHFENHSYSIEPINCYKLDKYIYIYIKLTREIGVNNETKDFINVLETAIKNLKNVSLLKNKNYNAKKYLYYRVTHLFR